MVKSKTPMCLVNELSRHNNVQHQYHLVEESGPLHGKTFTVVLKLGDREEYKATGSSIRKAQHAAAEKALLETKLSLPSPKTAKQTTGTNMPLTPTVELNVLAMKRGEPAVYQVYEPPRAMPATLAPFAPPSAAAIYDFRGMYNQRYHYPRGLYCATVTVGSKQFTGKGKTAQAARHAAAEEALKVIRELPLPEHRQAKEQVAEENKNKSPISLVHEMALKRSLTVKFDVVSQSGPSHMPSFITRCIVGNIVTESDGNGKKLAKRRAAEKMLEELMKLPPLPPSEDVAETDSKAQRKKNFVKKKKPFLQVKNEKCTNTTIKQVESSNCKISTEPILVKNVGANESKQTVHPISRLIQLQQAKKEREPEFRVIAEHTLEKRKREFVIECTITNAKSTVINGSSSNVITATGSGSNKKVARKKAAEAMLHLLGYCSKEEQLCTTPNQFSPQSILKNQPQEEKVLYSVTVPPEASNQGQKTRKVKFVESQPLLEAKDHHAQAFLQQAQPLLSPQQQQHLAPIKPKAILPVKALGRQLVPGLLFMPAVDNTLETSSSMNTDTSVTEGEKRFLC